MNTEQNEELKVCVYSGTANGTPDMKSLYKASQAMLKSTPQPDKNSGWVNCSERLPENEIPVLILCKNNVQNVAFWVGETTISTQDRSFEGDTVYDDETDQSYWPEGWYCWEESSELHMNVMNTVTHWQPLPQPPVLEKL